MCLTCERSEHLVEVMLIQSPEHTPIHCHMCMCMRKGPLGDFLSNARFWY